MDKPFRLLDDLKLLIFFLDRESTRWKVTMLVTFCHYSWDYKPLVLNLNLISYIRPTDIIHLKIPRTSASFLNTNRADICKLQINIKWSLQIIFSIPSYFSFNKRKSSQILSVSNKCPVDSKESRFHHSLTRLFHYL